MNGALVTATFEPVRRRPTLVSGIAAAVLTVGVVTFVSWFLIGPERLPDVVMVYLLGVVVVAIRFGYVPSLLSAILGVGAFDFFFTAPYFSFVVDDSRYVVTCAIMLFVAFVISNLAERVRKQAAAAMALARKAHHAELETQSERLRNALLSSVSHDLRTPLAVVKGAATALLADNGDGDESSLSPARRREYLVTISDEASRLNRLVRNLLDMTSLEARAMHVKKEWQPLEEVIGVALARLEDRLADRPVVVTIPADLPLVPIDATLLEQVFVNLVENAAKHTPSGAPLEIGARWAAGHVEVEVSDAGPGIPPGEEERIFDKFHRASRTSEGMGLGLTICRGIVTAHGGTITCANRAAPESGATFRFTLPCGSGEARNHGGLPEIVEEL